MEKDKTSKIFLPIVIALGAVIAIFVILIAAMAITSHTKIKKGNNEVVEETENKDDEDYSTISNYKFKNVVITDTSSNSSSSSSSSSDEDTTE